MKIFRLLMAAPFLLSPLALAAQDATEVNPLIVGGMPVPAISDTPWQVALVVHGTRNSFCGGSLVAPGWVLTAAHCVDNPTVRGDASRLDVVAGTLTYASGGVQQTVTRIIINPGWKSTKFQYDFDAALLKLSGPLAISDDIKPIAMNKAGNELPPGITVRVSGWGATSQGGAGSPELLYVEMPTIANKTCNEPQSYNGAVTEEMYCAGERAGGKDACQGDSGGPSDTVVGGADTLVGVVSWGIGCAQQLKYGVYTRVAKISDWATQTMAGQ